MPNERLDEIMELLRADPSARAEVETGIKNYFAWFRRVDRLFAREHRLAMIASAKNIMERIDGLGEELRRAPRALRNYLTLPPAARDFTTRAEVWLPSPDSPLHVLRWMHAECKKLVKEERRGPQPDREQRHCAILAYILMKRFSDRRINGNRDGPFLRLASVLYEELTGSDPVDFYRHCMAVLRHPPPVTR
jgi:hypothetical protein